MAVYLTQEADIIFIALGDSVKLGKAQVDFSFCSPWQDKTCHLFRFIIYDTNK